NHHQRGQHPILRRWSGLSERDLVVLGLHGRSEIFKRRLRCRPAVNAPAAAPTSAATTDKTHDKCGREQTADLDVHKLDPFKMIDARATSCLAMYRVRP